MGLAKFVAGKWQAARALVGIARTFRNWPDVWAAYRGRGPLPPFQLRSGLTFEHAPEDDALSLYQEVFVQRQYTAGGFYRPRPGDTVLDLGANVGLFALYLQGVARGVRVHCFEPASDTRARLQRNIDRNGLDGYVAVYPVAVGGKPGTFTLRANAASVRRTLLTGAPHEQPGGEAVEVVTLAEAVRRTKAERIALLKIDIEGAEVDVLRDPDPTPWAKVDRVAVEFHGVLRPGARDAVIGGLRDRGFRLAGILAPTPDGQDGIVRAAR